MNEPTDHKWVENTVLTTGEPILNVIDENRLNPQGNVKARIKDMYSYLQPLLVKCPKIIIIHTGTNVALELTSRQLMDKLMELKSFILERLPNSKVICCTPVMLTYQAKALLTINKLNDLLNEKHKNEIINNDDINESLLGRKVLHLSIKEAG